MAAGLPVIASDVPACREILAHGEAGVLVLQGICTLGVAVCRS